MGAMNWQNPEVTNETGSIAQLPFGHGPIDVKNSKIFYFDIDNCLYERSTKIHDMMQVKIHQYFKSSLELDDKEAHELHMTYYKTYGLAIEGLVRNHHVDALEYNSKVDDALDLKKVLKPDAKLRQMLLDIKNSGQFDYLWLVTNAYKNHALRVITFLGIGDLFDGLTFCDYGSFPIICKPMSKYFLQFLETTGVDHLDSNVMKNQHFVDDSGLNVKAAFDLGFGHVFHYVEIDSEYELLLKSTDYEKYYGEGKITILRHILDLKEKLK